MSSTVSLRITLRYKDLDEFGARYAENISSAGLFLRTRTPKPTGTRIRFELLLADGARAFFGEGVVVSVRHDDKAGMGIRYHSLDPDSQLVMEKIVAQHGEGPLAPTPLGIPAKQAGSSVWRPGAAPQWGAAQAARPSAPPSSGGLLPRDGWGRPRTPPKSDAPPPPKEVRRRSATLRPWERTGSEVAQVPKAAETPDDLSRTLLLPEWDDLARTTIVGAESPAGLARPPDQNTVRLSVPEALSGPLVPPGYVPPIAGQAAAASPEELPAIHAWRPSNAPPGRSVWTVPGAPSQPASEGPTSQIDLRSDDAEAQSTARIDLSLVQAAGVRAAEAAEAERADPAWLEELSSSEIQPLTVPVGEEGEWNVEAAHAALREQEAAARAAAEEAEAARIAQLAAREVSQLRAAEAERALEHQAQQAEALRNADTMSFEAPETREAREQHLQAEAAIEAEAQRIAAADAQAREAAAREAREAEALEAQARAAREAEAHEAEARAAREAEAREAEARAAEAAAREAESREAEARAAEAAAREAGARAAEAEARAAEVAAREAGDRAAEAEAREAEARAAEAAAREAEAREAEARAAAAEAREAEARAAEAEAREAEARAAAAEAREAEAREAEAREAEAREAEARAAAAAAREAEARAAEAAAREAEARAAEAVAREAEAREAEARAVAAEARAAEAREAEAREAEARAVQAAAREAEAREAEARAVEAAAREAEAREAEAREAAAEAREAEAERARQAAAAAREAEDAEALRIAQAAAREAAALAAAPRPAETASSGGPTERVGVNVHPIDELPRPLAEAAADATIADVTFKSWASEVGPASNVPAPAGGTTERIDLPPPILFADPEPVDPTPILAVGVATEAALATALPSQTPEPDYALVQPVSEGLRASLPPEEGGTPGLRAPIHLAVREIDDREAVLPFEPPSLGLDPEPTPAPRAAELRVSSKLGSAPLVDEAFARDDQAIRDQSNALSRPRSARTIVERVPSSELVVEPTGRLEPKAQLDAASPGAGGHRIEVASELYRAEAPAPRAKPGDEVITAVEIERKEAPRSTATQLKEEEGTQRIDVHQARLDVNEVIAQSAARVPLEARTELLSSAHPPVPAAHPAPTLSTAVSVGPVAPSVEAAREAAKEAPRREVSSASAGPVAPSRAPAVDAQDLRRAVGIDIGGRYARVALLELGKVDLLKIDGHPALPAVVALLPSGTLVAGAEALAEPESSRVSVRALLLAISGLAVAPVENVSGRWVAKIAGENVELLEILRVFFQPLGAAATRALGTPKVRGILLVPPGASNEAIDLVQRAAKATGLDITEAVPEPLAAGRAYDLDRQPVETALVIDVAATHLGATVLRRGREGLRPVGGKSWPSPSGADLDHALGAVVNEEVKKVLGRPAPEDAGYLAQLEAELDRARRDLRRDPAVDLKLKVGERAITVKLARPRAFQATEPVVSEILSKVREVLSEAGVHPRALGAVVVVGSAGGYGGLSQALQALTGREALSSIDPLTGPFHGLTRPSELIKAPEDRLAPSEGIPFDIGIGLPGGRFRALFPAGTKLPAKQSKKHATTKDAQAEMEFSLYEGRGELLSECRPLGTVSLSGLPRAARGQVQVELELELDLDAVLACTLSEPKSGHKRRVELPTANTPAARKKSLESRPSIEDFGTAPKPKTKVGLLGRLLGKS